MKNPVFYSLLIPACLALATSASSAAFQDHFDNGLTNWTVGGDVAVKTLGSNNYAFLTTAYTTEADDAPFPAGTFNVSGINPLAAGGDLETAAGIPVGGLDLDPINQATEGSLLAKTFTVNAGDELDFDWQLFTNDTVDADYLFLTINGARMIIASATDATTTSTDYALQTALHHFEFTFATSGTVNLSIGVTDIGDYAETTAASIDNVRVAAVPEPNLTSFGGVAAALGAVITAVFRRRKIAAARLS